jgi:hypothetical protein
VIEPNEYTDTGQLSATIQGDLAYDESGGLHPFLLRWARVGVGRCLMHKSLIIEASFLIEALLHESEASFLIEALLQEALLGFVLLFPSPGVRSTCLITTL